MRIGLKTIIFVGGGLLLLAPAVVAGTIFSSAMQRRAEAANGARLRVLGEIAADQLGRSMHQLWQNVEGMGRIVSMDDPQEARRQFDLLGQVDRRYTWVGMADVEGKVVAASQGMLEGQSVAERPWFRRGLNGPAATDVHAAVLLEKLLPATQEPRRFVDFSAPVKNAEGAVTGVIGAHFDWSFVQDSLQAMRGPGMEMLLISRERTVLSGPEGLRGTTLSVGSAIAAGQAASVSLRERWPDGKDYITVVIPSVKYADMPSFGWSVIVRADTNSVLDPTRTITRTFWTILGAGMLVALGLLYLLATWVATPLRRLAGTAEYLASGRSDAPPYDETRYDEASRLSAALVRLQSQSVRPYQPAGNVPKTP
ncbi:cache domain-containing protein [Microvirga sp. ACRRW]|uniref:cache domain-containing protein n=1 Tax=Microvirga sp. ACRRW TaxID=2918205 RepID=UPI001EF72E38|nr:cache domain-containing protein [Microvirga sp. ACRRW]MCG7394113.1 cache domain-containing protein [Microvirga sp. ACRRW]